MKAMLLIIVAIIISVPAELSAQTKVAKLIGARIFTQQELDSVKTMLSNLDDSTPVTMEILRAAMTYAHDVTLRDGHREYMSMPGFFKRQVYKTVMASVDSVNLRALEEDAEIYSVIRIVEQNVGSVGSRVGLVETAIAGDTKKAKQAALDKIKALLKSRRQTAR